MNDPARRRPSVARHMKRKGGLALLAAVVLLAAAVPAQAQFNQYTRAPIRNPDRLIREYVWSYKELRERQVVMQKLDYSCGAAALATVFRYYWGANVNEETFLRLIPKLNLTAEEIKDRVENGLTLTDLRDLANLAGYQSSMGKVKFQDLAESKVPVIVGITIRKHDHFAVFRGTDGYYVYLGDSIRGNIRLPIPEFLEQWQENAILVVAKPNSQVKKINPMGIRFTEVFRGLLNDQYVHRNYTMTQVPNPVRVAPLAGRQAPLLWTLPLARIALRSSRPAWPPFASPQGLLGRDAFFAYELPLSKTPARPKIATKEMPCPISLNPARRSFAPTAWSSWASWGWHRR